MQSHHMRGSCVARIMRERWEAAAAHRLPAREPLPSPAQCTRARSAVVPSVSLCRYVVMSLCRQVSPGVVRCRYVSLCRHVAMRHCVVMSSRVVMSSCVVMLPCCCVVMSLCRHVSLCVVMSSVSLCRYVVMSSPSTCSPFLPDCVMP